MLKATLKGIVAHKLRLVSTFVAVMLGVSLVAGTYVLGDTIQRTFDRLFGEITKKTDIVVRGESAFGGDSETEERAPVPESLLAEIRQLDGVHAADGDVQGYAQIVDKQGEAIAPTGPPTLGVSYSADDALTPLELVDGRRPNGGNEVAIDRATASKHGLHVGDRVKILFKGPAREFTITGIVKFGDADNLAGATLAAFDTQTAQDVVGTDGQFDSISVVADDGTDVEALGREISKILPAGYEAVTGEQVGKESAKAVKEGLGFFTTFLLVFALIALFVGAFIIFNTFSIIVAQRTRELAMLRALGASRRQVLLSVILEAVVVGVLASLAWLALGVLIASGLTALLKGLGIDLPSGNLVFATRTAVVSMVLGVVVTTVSAIVPARKAARVPPVAAMRDVAVERERSLRRRLIEGGAVLAVGLGLLFTGLYADIANPLAYVGLGALVSFVGVSMLSPIVARRLSGWLGAPLPRLFGVTGRLAQQNAMRNPRRTASTASALMIGIGLVGAVSVMAASASASVDDLVDKSLKADFVVSGSGFATFSPELATKLSVSPGVASVTSVRAGQVKIGGSRSQVQAADGDTLGDTIGVDMVDGELSSLAQNEMLVSKKRAKEKGWEVGDTVRVTFGMTGTKPLLIGGIYEANQFLGDQVISLDTYERNFRDQLDFVVLVKAVDGQQPLARKSIEALQQSFPNVEVRDQEEFKQQQHDQVNQMLGLVYALLLLAVVIALIGIMNTMSLSVFERTHEIGLARAVGMSRRQVRRTIRWEAVIVSVFGAVIGVVVGLAFGTALVKALADEGITSVALPFGSVVVFVVAAGVAGMGAAILPARRASRLNVLAAIASE